MVNIVVISVTDTKKARAAAAANALAAVLLDAPGHAAQTRRSPCSRTQLAQGQKEYAAATARSVAAQQAIAAIAKGSASPWPRRPRRPLPISPSSRRAATEQESDLAASNQKTELLLLTAKQVEQPRILHEAGIPDSPSGPTMSLNVAIGALAGLVIGIIVAFARRALADRRAGRTAAA